jgi:hypothetical protein
LSTFFFAEKQGKNTIDPRILENGCQSQFQDHAFNAGRGRDRFASGAPEE